MSKAAHYTDADRDLMRALAGAGCSHKEIAATMKRSVTGIAGHMHKHNIRQVRAQPNSEGYGSSYISGDGMDWSAMTWDRLCWQYGSDQADRITAGKDPKTQADVAGWNRLGRRSAA